MQLEIISCGISSYELLCDEELQDCISDPHEGQLAALTFLCTLEAHVYFQRTHVHDYEGQQSWLLKSIPAAGRGL